MVITHLAAIDIPFETVFPEMHVRWKRSGKIRSTQETQTEYLFIFDI